MKNLEGEYIIVDDSSNDISLKNSLTSGSGGGDDGGNSGSPPNCGSKTSISSNSTDGQIFQMLKLQIEKQRDEIKLKDRELNERNGDIENVS